MGNEPYTKPSFSATQNTPNLCWNTRFIFSTIEQMFRINIMIVTSDVTVDDVRGLVDTFILVAWMSWKQLMIFNLQLSK